MNTPPIQHHEKEQHFILSLDGAEAKLQYELSPKFQDKSPKVVNFTHTFVPPEFRGKGLAESLVRSGLKWAKDEGHEISASCWYVQKFLR